MFGSGTARRNANGYRRKGVQGSAREIVERVRERAVGGATVLEVGGGVGAVQLELLRAGAERATNVELSPEYESEASALAVETGLAGRVERLVGDFAELAPSLPAADVVVMHRVICCYPFLEPLLAPAAEHTRRLLALTYPRDHPVVRLALGIANAGFALARCSFRAFAHPVADIDRIARERGLTRVFLRSGLVWQTALYERAVWGSGQLGLTPAPREGSWVT